jgi:aminodeoxyfutalosine synthase
MIAANWFDDVGIGSIHRKISAGQRLTLADGEQLFACPDVLAVGALAHMVRRQRHGKITYYVVNQHLNYSNICINGCRFCAFGKPLGDPQTFQFSLEDVRRKVSERLDDSITEIHMVGGCHPSLPLQYYEELLQEIKRLRPGTWVKAFTAVEIAHMAKLENLSTDVVLRRLKAAGLDMLPGGGAEIFSPRVRSLLCPEKLSGGEWLAVMREAHEMGLRSNATMLYGHVESTRERLEHLIALRRLQDDTGGFVCFIPLPFQSGKTAIVPRTASTAVDDLKTMAVSRLMLDNFPHVKAYWIMLTLKLAQVALHFGADDLDGTVIEEKIGHMAGASSEPFLTRDELEHAIRSAGFDPVERNCFFEPVGAASQAGAGRWRGPAESSESRTHSC